MLLGPIRKFTFSFNKQEYIWSTFIKVLIKKTPSNYLDRELHTRCVVSDYYFARGVWGKFDKNGGVRCILSVPKLVIINLKINIFFYNTSKRQNPNFVPYFSIRLIQMRTLAQINTFTFNKGDPGVGWGGWGWVNSPQKPKKCKKMEALRFLQQTLHTGRKDISCNDVDSDSC